MDLRLRDTAIRILGIKIPMFGNSPDNAGSEKLKGFLEQDPLNA